MLESLPRRALLRFEIPIHYIDRTPRIDGNARKWHAKHLLPPLVELEDREPFADAYAAWSDDGFIAAFDVPDRAGPPQVDAQAWWKLDGVRLCLDTRDARDIKRATRFCHFFYALPAGGGPRKADPIVGTHRMSRAKEPPPAVDLAQIKVASHVERKRYFLEMFIPASCLNGWDPAEHPRIGLFYKVKDVLHGAQHLSADDEMGWNVDPGTWATAVLTR
jgi:hypothetical protein